MFMSPSLPPLGVLAGALLLLVVQSAGAADCTYRKDSLGNTRYQCDDGNSGTLRKDSLGNVRGFAKRHHLAQRLSRQCAQQRGHHLPQRQSG